MRRITFDIETMGEFRGNGDFSNQEVTIVGVHDSETDSYSSYTKEELPKLWPLMESADLLIGYNSDHFDIPILNKYYAGDLGKIKSIDLLKEVKNVLGRRLKLDSIAQATLGEGKSGHGLDAVKWWAEGKVDLVRKYCLDDVRITKDIYEYAKKHGSLKYKDFDGVREVKLDTSSWETPQNGGASLTHTLPF
ncbi:MAG TPA: ribonuclease H-like domain-containing protein [Candidatus Paceibacterota bacterium]|nr:ribonuclease H-like domain-containing protein [Candidatus Paceibacterota bacterium]